MLLPDCRGARAQRPCGLKRWAWGALPLIAGLLTTAVVAAEEFESVANLQRRVRTFLRDLADADRHGDTQIVINPIDERLRLRRCDHDPIAELAPGAKPDGNTTVNVRCEEPVRWSVFVPARVERYDAVIVVVRPLGRDQVIQSEDVRLERRKLSELAGGYVTDPESVIGWQAKRALVPGQVINGSLIKPRLLIRRGETVTLISQTSGVRVSALGEALEDGIAGQRIRVRNRSSKRVVDGIVEAPGIVRVPL